MKQQGRNTDNQPNLADFGALAKPEEASPREPQEKQSEGNVEENGHGEGGNLKSGGRCT